MLRATLEHLKRQQEQCLLLPMRIRRHRRRKVVFWRRRSLCHLSF